MTASSIDSERSIVRLNTKGFCIFCLKRNGSNFAGPTAIYDDGDKSVYVHECKIDVKELEEGSRLRQQFSKVISSYLETNFNCLKQNNTKNDKCSRDAQSESDDELNKRFDTAFEVDVSYICQDCSHLVEKICKLYHEMKQIELEVDWKVRQLKHIAAFAMRAPTRLKVFKEKFNNSGDQKDKDDLARIEMFRKELLEKCSLKFKKAQPRIVLKRNNCKSPDNLENKKAKLSQQKSVTLNDVEVQTDWVAIGEMIDIDPTHIPSLMPPSPGTHPNDEGLDVDNSTSYKYFNNHASVKPVNSLNHNSTYQVRIRPIESLASPTKSITPVKLNHNSGKGEIIEVIQLHNGKQLNEPGMAGNSGTGNLCDVDVVWKNKDLGNKRTSLTQWLESTFKCDRCKKLFISEATLNVHKNICGAEAREEGAHISSSDNRIDHENESNEGVIDSAPSFGDDNSSNQDGGDHADDSINDVDETPEESLPSAPNTRTCTIRILKKTPQLAHSTGTRFCKYCSANITSHHFSRHRITMKHKLNKRQHKRAKKLGIAGAGTSTNGTGQNLVGEAGNDKNVKIVKIIYVTKGGTEGESQNSNDDVSMSSSQNVTKESIGDGARGNENGTIALDDNGNHEIIDISD